MIVNQTTNVCIVMNMIPLTTRSLTAKSFVGNAIHWFNATNNSQFTPTVEEKLFSVLAGPYENHV